jgi:hypothetical protein
VSDPVRYYLSEDGKRLGPYSADQIRKRLNQGKSAETDYIWRDGFDDWKSIADVLSELPPEEPPPALEAIIPSSLTINHFEFPDIPTTKLEIPARGFYEPKATLSQKNKLMKLGCTTPELLRNLGRDQASFMIDAFLDDAQAVFQHERHKLALAQRRAVGIALLVLFAMAALCIVVWMVVTLVGRSSSMQNPVAVERQEAQGSPNGASTASVRTIPPDAIVDQIVVRPSTSPLTPSSPSSSENFFDLKVGATVSLNRDVAVQVGSRVITLAGGHRMTFLGREGRDAARIRYAGADYIVPFSALRPAR